ncbi:MULTISPECIES: YrhB domain-containing protein [unclassified Streptomyces]|uniref:YrhB domain-containing protein n=1 Tax=unclassified Streptomyces TaxID=2593676 RepID=UPI002DDBF91B|nr:MULTISPECIES: YrhB domain-containing protein [unclassified Streptomyces]WSA91734.1 YrhB family protein [Streptomyces sp. NBC_01795]WSB76104.1 YrhB family protein [Streptomyces sp. NBC_01775]WSS15622.1 YrhB family protein [Streptomyces sp. NBC_01186]WSS44463.1 YrhB family protein [Streptomyces sp. NBC_01187]
MMLTFEDALDAARAYLRTSPYEDQFTLVMQPELSRDYGTAWGVRFDSQEHLDTGDEMKAPFTRVVVVPKNGAAPHLPPTHLPVAEYVAQLAAQQPPAGA